MGEDGRLLFSRNEFTGAVGDAATVLPLIVAIAALTELSLAIMLLWFGVFQIASGLYFGVPLSVEPMKALAAVLLAGGLSTGEFLLSGLLLGVVLLILGLTKSLSRVSRWIDDFVIRGIQLGVALVLIEAGLGLGLDDPVVAGIGVAVGIGMLLAGASNASALAILGLGAVIALVVGGIPSPQLPPGPELYLGSFDDLSGATLEVTIAQLGMTLGNATFATAALLGMYFHRETRPDELATSMGIMNLVAVPLGAIPMCHGSGGVAGKYAFGARTAGANVILGIGYGLVGVLGVGVLLSYPIAVLGVILIFVGVELGRTSLETDTHRGLIVVIGLVGLFGNLGLAFAFGILLGAVFRMRGGDS